MAQKTDRMEKIDTSDEQCAVVCMLVSNPGGGDRPHAWQKRVNDLIRALRDERSELKSVAKELVASFSQPKYHGWDMPRLHRARDAAKRALAKR